MTSLESSTSPTRIPLLVREFAAPAAALAGVAWNLFGVHQFLGTLDQTPQSLMEMGLTPAQAEVLGTYPDWMTFAFGVGVFGGLVGSLLLLAKKRLATPVFAASLVGYLVLYVGDITEGVFEALGAPQVAILSAVVLIGVGLLGWSRRLEVRGALR